MLAEHCLEEEQNRQIKTSKRVENLPINTFLESGEFEFMNLNKNHEQHMKNLSLDVKI